MRRLPQGEKHLYKHRCSSQNLLFNAKNRRVVLTLSRKKNERQPNKSHTRPLRTYKEIPIRTGQETRVLLRRRRNAEKKEADTEYEATCFNLSTENWKSNEFQSYDGKPLASNREARTEAKKQRETSESAIGVIHGPCKGRRDPGSQ